jgi:hypothetical protein
MLLGEFNICFEVFVMGLHNTAELLLLATSLILGVALGSLGKAVGISGKTMGFTAGLVHLVAKVREDS